MTKVMKYSLIATIVLLTVSAWSQEAPAGEVGFDYSYMRFAPNGAFTNGHSLNGGGGSMVYNLNRVLGIKADFQGYGSNTSTFVIAPGPNFPTGGAANVQGNLFTYLFGPQIKLHSPRVQPFVHLLFGGAHSNVYGNAFKNICQPVIGACAFSKAPSNNAFAMAFGGGIDFAIGKSVSIRPVEIDYLFTDFTNQFNNAHENNFRYSGGINFNFGSRGGGQ
jgi:opacity protein-like surface antigen